MTLKKAFFSFVLLCTIATLTHLGFGVAVGLSSIGTFSQGEKQILADGDMEASGVSSWAYISNRVAVSKETADPSPSGSQYIKILGIEPLTDFKWIYQGALQELNTYRCTGWARASGMTASVGIGGSGPSTFSVATDGSGWNYFDVSYTTEVGRTVLYLGNPSGFAGAYTEWDNVFCTKYKGGAVNAEKQLLADGDMQKSGTSDWTLEAGTKSKISGAAADGSRILRISNGALGWGFVQQTVLTFGKTYKVTGWARGDGTSQPLISMCGGYIWTGTVSTDWQKIDVTGVCIVSPTNKIYLEARGTEGSFGEYDDIFVTEYKGKTVVQSNIAIHDDIISQAGVEANGGSVVGTVGFSGGKASIATDHAGRLVWDNGSSAELVGDTKGTLRIKFTAPSADVTSNSRIFGDYVSPVGLHWLVDIYSGNVRLFVGTANDNALSYPISIGETADYVFAWDGTKGTNATRLQMYKNGTAVTPTFVNVWASAFETVAGSKWVAFGQEPSLSSCYAGAAIDKVTVWRNVQLNAEEVADLYQFQP